MYETDRDAQEIDQMNWDDNFTPHDMAEQAGWPELVLIELAADCALRRSTAWLN